MTIPKRQPMVWGGEIVVEGNSWFRTRVFTRKAGWCCGNWDLPRHLVEEQIVGVEYRPANTTDLLNVIADGRVK